MIAALDVQYGESLAIAAAVGFGAWTDQAPAFEVTALIQAPLPYEPGSFWKRELPCLQAALERLPQRPTLVAVDGYVWLNAEGRPGLGAHLFEALGRSIPVVGIAKTPFDGSEHARAVLRGASRRALHVTAVGLPLAEAAAAVASMHGQFRIPTLLHRADSLCRETLRAKAAIQQDASAPSDT